MQAHTQSERSAIPAETIAWRRGDVQRDVARAREVRCVTDGSTRQHQPSNMSESSDPDPTRSMPVSPMAAGGCLRRQQLIDPLELGKVRPFSIVRESPSLTIGGALAQQACRSYLPAPPQVATCPKPEHHACAVPWDCRISFGALSVVIKPDHQQGQLVELTNRFLCQCRTGAQANRIRW